MNVTEDPSTAELVDIVERGKLGDQSARAELFTRYRARVEGFARTFVHERGTAEDITQTVFLKMIRKLPYLREAEAFESWLFAMARSTALDFLRRRRRRPEDLVDSFEHVELVEEARPWLMAEISEVFEAALAELSTLDRQVMRMLIDGNTYEFIAARNGLTTGAVKGRLYRIRRVLRVSVGTATGTRVEPGHSMKAAA